MGVPEIQTAAPPGEEGAELLAATARRYPSLFAHWRLGVKPDGWTMGAV
jgi:hypothetical protein